MPKRPPQWLQIWGCLIILSFTGQNSGVYLSSGALCMSSAAAHWARSLSDLRLQQL